MSKAKRYMIVTATIDRTKMSDLQHYLSNAMPLFAAHGGEMVARYSVEESVHGDANTEVVIIMAFPSADAIRTLFASPDYLPLVEARNRAHPTLDIFIASDFNPADISAAQG